jgi:hypothetical protein
VSHASSVDLHDHVYGFRTSAHVEACPDCRLRAERLEAERRELREALAEPAVEPPAHVLRPAARRPWASMAAAASLLAVLAGLLYAPRPRPAQVVGDEAIARLVREAKSASEIRRELAWLGLKAYGAQCHPALVAAGFAPAETEPFKTPSAEDLALKDRVNAVRVTLDMADVTVADVLTSLVAKAPVPVDIAPGIEADLAQQKMSIKVQDIGLGGAFTLLLSRVRLDAYVLDGRLRVGPPRTFLPSSNPVRVGPSEAELWAALDGPAPHEAAAALRKAYAVEDTHAVVPREADLALARALHAKRVTVFADDEEVMTILDDLRRQTDVNIHLGTAVDVVRVTFRGRGLPLYAALRLMLDPYRLVPELRDGVVLIRPMRAPDPSPEAGPFWRTPDVARRINAALAALGREDAAARERAEAELVALASASIGPLRASTGPGARAALLRVYRELGIPLEDDPPRAYLASRGAAGDALLARRWTVDAQEKTLPEILRAQGVAVRAESPDPRTFTFKGEVSLQALLDALTRPSATLDWRIEGETVVLDARGNVRAAAEPAK